MAKIRKTPDYTKGIGLKLVKIADEHPIFQRAFIDAQKLYPHSNFTDKQLIKMMVDNFEELASTKGRTVILPYSVILQTKLKNIL